MLAIMIRPLVRLPLMVAVGLFSTGFTAATLDNAVPEWSELGSGVRLAGTLATVIVTVLYAIRIPARRHEPFQWGLDRLVRPVIAALLVFLVCALGNLAATMILAGRPAATGMTGGTLDPAQLPLLHFGAPLAGLALAGLYLGWSWRRNR